VTHLLDEYKENNKFKKYFDNDKVSMKNITINIPEQYDLVIKKLINMKLIPNRSEAIRTALREFLSKEFSNIELMEEFLNNQEE
jgi:Arc/MetJ-type ribon-helix-helix transcriptional regulator